MLASPIEAYKPNANEAVADARLIRLDSIRISDMHGPWKAANSFSSLNKCEESQCATQREEVDLRRNCY